MTSPAGTAVLPATLLPNGPTKSPAGMAPPAPAQIAGPASRAELAPPPVPAEVQPVRIGGDRWGCGGGPELADELLGQRDVGLHPLRVAGALDGVRGLADGNGVPVRYRGEPVEEGVGGPGRVDGDRFGVDGDALLEEALGVVVGLHGGVAELGLGVGGGRGDDRGTGR